MLEYSSVKSESVKNKQNFYTLEEKDYFYKRQIRK